jgi:hypothetical protein
MCQTLSKKGGLPLAHEADISYSFIPRYDQSIIAHRGEDIHHRVTAMKSSSCVKAANMHTPADFLLLHIEAEFGVTLGVCKGKRWIRSDHGYGKLPIRLSDGGRGPARGT